RAAWWGESDPSGVRRDRTARTDRRMCPLWILPPRVPDVRAVGRGDGLPARADPPGDAAARRGAGRAGTSPPGRVPRLPRVRAGLPVRGALRRDRGGVPGPGRARGRPGHPRPGTAGDRVRAVPVPAPAGRTARTDGAGAAVQRRDRAGAPARRPRAGGGCVAGALGPAAGTAAVPRTGPPGWAAWRPPGSRRAAQRLRAARLLLAR